MKREQCVRPTKALRIMNLNLPFVAYVNGILLLILSSIELMTGFIGLLSDIGSAREFIGAGLLAGFIGGMLALCNFRGPQHHFGIHSGYFLTVTSWLTISLFSTLPLYFAIEGISFTDAFFETVSAISTTGSTVLTGLDHLPRDILFWRSVLQWMGGIGIIVMAMAILPLLRVGGMSLFKSESSDISGKVSPRMPQFLKMTIFAYVGLTLSCTILLYFAGMPMFDALNHAMTTIATGGFSTHDSSAGYFDSASIEFILTVFMLAGALPLIIYSDLIFSSKKNFSLSRYSQVFTFLGIWLIAVIAMTLWNCIHNHMLPAPSLRVSSFNVTSVLTDTGFATTDFGQWGSFSDGLVFFLFFVGGCAGSTSGAIKIFRWQILFKGLYANMLRTLSPHRVVSVHYAGMVVEESILHGVRNFLFLYLLTFALFSLILMGFGADFITSTSGVAQAMANAGPGLGPVIGPASNFSTLPSGAKWALCAAMMLGRLELYTIYVLFLPAFWRR